MLHNETTLAVVPPVPKVRMLHEKIDGMLKLRQQGLRQSHTGIVSVKLSRLPQVFPSPGCSQ